MKALLKQIRVSFEHFLFSVHEREPPEEVALLDIVELKGFVQHFRLNEVSVWQGHNYRRRVEDGGRERTSDLLASHQHK